MQREAVVTFTGIGIPAEVFLHPELTNVEKLLFGFIRNISYSSKGCWASNRWLSQWLSIHPNNISKALSNLQQQGFIKIKMTPKFGVTGESERRIFICDFEKEHKQLVVDFNNQLIGITTEFSTPLNENTKGGTRKHEGGITKTRTNNVLNNVLNKEKYKKEKTSENFVHLLPTKFRNDKLFQQSWEEFVQHRKTMKPRPKPLSELAAKKCINKLIKLSNSDIETAIALIDQTIEKNNDTFWPLYKSNEIAKTKQPTTPPKKKNDAYQKNIDNQPDSIWSYTSQEDLDALQEADNQYFRKHRRRMNKSEQERWLEKRLGF